MYVGIGGNFLVLQIMISEANRLGFSRFLEIFGQFFNNSFANREKLKILNQWRMETNKIPGGLYRIMDPSSPAFTQD